MKKHYIHAVGELVQIKENVESEYFIPYQDSMVTLSLNYLTEEQKLNVLRHIVALTDGKILESIPMQLPTAANEKKYLEKCKRYKQWRTEDTPSKYYKINS